MAEMTPMMQKYMETKAEYPDCILFYRLGDFYEMFFEDAQVASKELELTLTGKSCGLEERAPMCGVPYHAVEGYLTKLVSKGHKVAICEQVEDPKLAKGLVKREVVRIVTPGTNLNMQSLEETRNNFLMCVTYTPTKIGLAATDVTTGDFYLTDVAFRKILATSFISTIKVDWPLARSSEAPTLVKILSTIPTLALLAGTKEPIWANRTISAD